MLADEQKEAEQKWIKEWWADRAGPITIDNLNQSQQLYLAAWLLITAATGIPRKRDDLPTEYLKAIQHLASVGKINPGRYKVTPRNPLAGNYVGSPGLVHGKARHVKVRKKRSRLAT